MSEQENIRNFTELVNEAKNALALNENAINFLRAKGFLDETIVRYNMGYHDGRILIPFNGTNSFYMEYTMDEACEAIEQVEPISTIESIYNGGALKNGNVLFVVESAFDAISICQAGARCIAIPSAKALISVLKEDYPNFNGILVLCLNHNVTGDVQKQALITYFDSAEIMYYDANICGQYETPNELLRADAALFIQNVTTTRKAAKEKAESIGKVDNIQHYLETKLNNDMLVFIDNKAKKTGFPELDQLSGGLQMGFYVLGGLSGSGKTTFVGQMADQIAESGEQVLYFTTEQSTLELVSKSITREAYNSGTNLKTTSSEIRAGEIVDFNNYATRYYNRVKTNLSIIETDYSFDLDKLVSYIDNFVRHTKTRPVVIIDDMMEFVSDYTRLRRVARNYHIPIIGVTYLNRENYMEPLDLTKFSDVERMADVIWGFELKILTEDVYHKQDVDKRRKEILDAEMRKSPRHMNLACYKNRYGARYNVEYEYYAQNDYFKEAVSHIEKITESDGNDMSYKNEQVPEWVMEQYKKSRNVR